MLMTMSSLNWFYEREVSWSWIFFSIPHQETHTNDLVEFVILVAIWFSNSPYGFIFSCIPYRKGWTMETFFPCWNILYLLKCWSCIFYMIWTTWVYCHAFYMGEFFLTLRFTYLFFQELNSESFLNNEYFLSELGGSFMGFFFLTFTQKMLYKI